MAPIVCERETAKTSTQLYIYLELFKKFLSSDIASAFSRGLISEIIDKTAVWTGN